MSNPNEPFGLPRGSVRALLAVILVATAAIIGLAATAYGILGGKIGDPVPLILAIVALAQVAVAAYFVQRAGSGGS